VHCRELDDNTSLEDMSFEQTTPQCGGSLTSVTLSVATTDSSSSGIGSSFNMSQAKVSGSML